MSDVTVDSTLWNITSQAAHVAVACAATMILKLHTPHWFVWTVIGVAIAAAAVKEFWYDRYYETTVERGSSLLDFAMYLTGLAAGYLLALVATDRMVVTLGTFTAQPSGFTFLTQGNT